MLPFARRSTKKSAPARGKPRSRSVRASFAAQVLLRRMELELFPAATRSKRSRAVRRPSARPRSRDPRT
eukprot:329793-Alexandrium_andersonii.AAC.1